MNLEALHSSARFGTTVQENLTILIDLDHSALGPTPKDVASAVRHVCGILLPDDKMIPLTTEDFYASVQDYYARFLRDDSSGRSALMFLCYFSSYYHELRHVHDLLASRTGQLLFYNAFRVFQNTPGLLNILWDWQKEHPDERIPLPLAKWTSIVPSFPSDVERFFTEWSKTTDIFRRFQDVDRYSAGSLSVVHLLETSAVNIQLDFVHDALGNDAVLDLTQLIQEEGNAALYLQVRSEIEEAFADADYKGTAVGSLINYLIWVALNQTASLDDPETFITPVRYFEFLTEELIRRLPAGQQLEMKDVRTTIDEICHDWRLANPQEMRRVTADWLAPRVQRMRDGLQAAGVGDRVKVLESVVAEYSAIHDLIDSAPQFMGQREYVWAVMYGLFPSVHVKVFSDGVARDLMTKGRQGISADDWIGCATWGGTLRLLADGMGKTKPDFHERICFNILRSPVRARPGLRFFNPMLSGFRNQQV